MPHNFIEAKIPTKSGNFNIRVYEDVYGKETIVLLSGKFHHRSPVLVRVHSECITGDMIGSLQCDCGEQLTKSLKFINKEGGILIYLRQEGRGIGLFEKIKAYQLQGKGLDTFEANVVLGHRPDERTYEMVKTVLNDLNIQRIRLLTNNPSKVSEIAKLGIDVVERVPLLIKPNKYNKRYFVTKRDNFQHFFNDDFSHYFYQFHAETPEHVKQIGDFIKDKKRDPLLKICVGVSANHSTLTDKNEIIRIESIFHICNLYKEFVPVLHFSFLSSSNVLEDIKTINKKMPFVNRLQINDLPSIEINCIKQACLLFSIDMPLCDNTFDVIHNKAFRNIVKKNKSFILLDNSKGRGIQETKDSLMKKIDTLLSYGINNIAILGGFGPDQLDRYFELRRYYKINFSIDAETKLKTNGKIDIEKTKLYLLQLLRFDDPDKKSVEQTKTFLEQHRRSDWDKITIENKEFAIHPSVFHAGVFPSTSWYASIVRERVKDHIDFCEVGCGAGVISCFVAMANPNMNIVATDINPFANENTRLNAQRLGLTSQIKVTTGDVLDALAHDCRFDTIFWALPFGFLDPGSNVTLEEMQVFDPGYKATRKLFKTAKHFLKSDGQILLGFSSDLGHKDLLLELAKQENIELEEIAAKEMKESNTIRFELIKGIYRDMR